MCKHCYVSLQEYFNMSSPVCRMTVVPDPYVITTQTIRLVFVEHEIRVLCRYSVCPVHIVL